MKNYVYTVARLRGMENHMLDSGFFTRLMDSANIDDALKLLGETSYAQYLNQDSNFDKAIDSEMLATLHELEQFVPDKELLTLFRIPYDFHNVKVLLKGLFKVRSGDLNGRRYDLLSKLASINTDELTEAVETEEYGFLPYGLTDIIPKCNALWEQTKDAQAVELLLDHQMFKAMLNLAENLNIPLVTKWVKLKIDAENLKTVIRLARLNFDSNHAMPFFHDGGTLGQDVFAKLLSEPQETWSRILSHTDIAKVLATLSEQQDLKIAFSDVSAAIDRYLIDVLESAKYSADDPANVLLFMLNKEAETRNMRVSLVCVSSGLDRDFARRAVSA